MIIFDMGSVLVPTKHGYVYKKLSEKCGAKKKVLREYLKTDEGEELRLKLQSGEIKFEKFWKTLKKRLDLEGDPEFAKKKWKKYSKKWIEKNEESVEYYNEILKNLKKKGVKFGLLSNTNAPTLKSAKKAKLFELFEEDLLIASYKIGYIKPQPEIYDKLIEKLEEKGYEPKDCLFVDDKERNLKEAEDKGFNTFKFDEETEFKKNWKNLKKYLKHELKLL